MHASIHRVTKITVDDPKFLDVTSSYVRHITIITDDERVEIAIFSDDTQSLKIDGLVKDSV